MKKLLATLLTGAVSIGCLCGLAACNPDGEEEQGNTPTVTADKWKEALSYFTVEWNEQDYMPILSDNPRVNFSVKQVVNYTYSDETRTSEITTSNDYTNQVSRLGLDVIEGEIPTTYYGWKDGEVYYSVGGGWHLNDETHQRDYFYDKEAVTEEQFKMGFDSTIYAYAGGDHILNLSLADKFADFTYSEEKEEYTATFAYEFYDADAAVTLKFNNGKIAYMSLNIEGGVYGDYVYTYEYTYGTTLTVPDYYLNLALGRTPRE